MLVQEKAGDDPTIIGPESKLRRAYGLVRPQVDMLPLKLYGRDGKFAVGWLPDDVNRQIRRVDPDVVHLNWMGRGFVNFRSIGDIDRPIVWRLPDMMAFTGGCLYADGCRKYTDSCGGCPQLGSRCERDLSRWTWNRKNESWADLDLTVVTPSTWLAERARESSLFGDRRVEVIPNALDTDVYKPADRETARDRFNLPREKKLVLFGAVDPVSDDRKGFDLLREALYDLREAYDGDDVELIVFGASEPEDPPDLGFPTRYTGFLHDDESLALLYSAADVMVVPSRYEGFGQTASESLACGTPVVAFDATGPRDIVEHEECGYLAEPYDPDDLARGIEWTLAEHRAASLSEGAREKAVSAYRQHAVAREYRDLYRDVVTAA